MKTKIKIINNSWKEKIAWVLAVLVAVFVPAHGLLSLAQDSGVLMSADNSTNATAQNVVAEENTTLAPITVDNYDKELILKKTKSSRFFNKIKLEIEASEDDLMSVNRNINENQDKLKASQDKIDTLQGQLANLNQNIANSQSLIENVEKQIEKKQSEIDTTKYELEKEQIAISFQKQMLAEYLKVIFQDRSKFSSIQNNDEQLNTLKLLLSEESTAENLSALRYSEILENEGRTIFEKLDTLIEEQKSNQQILELKQRTLAIMYNQLTDEKKQLEVEKQAKNNLLEQTKGEESVYQQLLEKSKQQQEEVLSQIDTLRQNMAFVEQKMKTLGDKFNPDDYAHLLNIANSDDLKNYLEGAQNTNAEFAPNWPVNPARGISAYFHDASYARFFGMQHNAIDIPAPQGTPIKSPADGFVYKVKDNGYGYSYLMLAHTNGYMTLYGHVSQFLVDEGESVKAGEIVALSGAMPGTRGAGAYTTGPHLHFEILKNGVHVDPLDYLNMALLRLDSLPEKYVAKALGDQNKVKRKAEKVRVKQSGLVMNNNSIQFANQAQ